VQAIVDDMDLGELDDAQTECVRGVFSDGVLKEFMESTLTGEEPGEEIFSLMGEISACGIDLFDS